HQELPSCSKDLNSGNGLQIETKQPTMKMADQPVLVEQTREERGTRGIVVEDKMELKLNKSTETSTDSSIGFSKSIQSTVLPSTSINVAFAPQSISISFTQSKSNLSSLESDELSTKKGADQPKIEAGTVPAEQVLEPSHTSAEHRQLPSCSKDLNSGSYL